MAGVFGPRPRAWAVLLWVAALTASAVPAAADCGRSCLRGFTERYLAALVRHDPSQLPLAAGIKFTENGRVLTLGQGLWTAASSLGGYREYFEDPVTGQAAFIGVVDAGSPAILALRLRIAEEQIAEVETVVARRGSHRLFAPEALQSPHPTMQGRVDPARRSSRDRLVAVTNTYFDGIEKHDSRVVLSDRGCDRFENGVQTTHRPGPPPSGDCGSSADVLTHIKAVKNRRFPIVDEDRGLVLSTILFDIPGEGSAPSTSARAVPTSAASQGPRTLLLMELFKVDDGRIQRIEAVMHNLPPNASSGWEE